MKNLVDKLKRYIPGFLKQILRFLCYGLKKMKIKRKNRNELWEFWKHPTPGNLPTDYSQVEERSQLLVNLIKRYVEPNAKILEIGCNVGRNLNYLFNAGYTKLEGVEINVDAINLMKQVYPQMAKHIKIYNNPIEKIIKDFGGNTFDVVFTMAVLEHIHSESNFIFFEIGRITKKYLITIEDEKEISWLHFPRNYKQIFKSLGMKQVYQFNCEGIKELSSNFWVRVFQK